MYRRYRLSILAGSQLSAPNRHEIKILRKESRKRKQQRRKDQRIRSDSFMTTKTLQLVGIAIGMFKPVVK